MKQKLKIITDRLVLFKNYLIVGGFLVLFVVMAGVFYYYQNSLFNSRFTSLSLDKTRIESEIDRLRKENEDLKNQDQIKINEELKKEIEQIKVVFEDSSDTYESILDLKAQKKDTSKFDRSYAGILSLISKFDYKSAKEKLSSLDSDVKKELQTLAAVGGGGSGTPPPVNNAPPGAGFSRQSVQAAGSTFTVSLIAGDLSSTRVIVDTASEGDCSNDCPTLPLATYVSRNGAFAGINGAYFCPAEYPSCAGKTNSFDLLLMNKNKKYFNSDNNVYSSNPGVVFGGGYVRFLSSVSQWGRDTGIDGMISNYPLLVFNSQVVYSGSSEAKFNSRGYRGFVANKGNTVYIGFVHSATMAESAQVLSSLGMQNALNLDSGGSTALWSGGYKLGPGRNLANSILFVKK